MNNISNNRISGSTNNYDLFIQAPGNRSLNKNSVLKIMDSIEHYGNCSAITCREIKEGNKKFYQIIDGQHRLEACKILGVPVHYDVWDIPTKTMIALNENQKKWGLEDYLNFGLQDKIEDYKIIKHWKEATDLSIGSLLRIFSGKDIGNESFKKLVWKIYDRKKSEQILLNLLDFYKKYDIKFYFQKRFVAAFLSISESEKYDHQRMLSQLEKGCASLLKRQLTTSEYIRNFEKVYNYQMSSGNQVIFPKHNNNESEE